MWLRHQGQPHIGRCGHAARRQIVLRGMCGDDFAAGRIGTAFEFRQSAADYRAQSSAGHVAARAVALADYFRGRRRAGRSGAARRIPCGKTCEIPSGIRVARAARGPWGAQPPADIGRRKAQEIHALVERAASIESWVVRPAKRNGHGLAARRRRACRKRKSVRAR